MSVCLFVDCSDDADAAAFAAIDGVERALVHSAAHAHDPYLDDGPPPTMALQLYFARAEHLPRQWPRPPLGYEAMEVHAFAVPDARIRTEPWCTYLVRYEGPAKDERAWLAHYLANHPPLMARLPGIRELEIYAPLDWSCGARRVRSLQRNKTAFDSPAALTAALNSPMREEMRKDFRDFPEYSGKVTHFPMFTRYIPGTRDPS